MFKARFSLFLVAFSIFSFAPVKGADEEYREEKKALRGFFNDVKNKKVGSILDLMLTNPDLPKQEGFAILHCTVFFHCFFKSSPFILPHHNNLKEKRDEYFIRAHFGETVREPADSSENNLEFAAPTPMDDQDLFFKALLEGNVEESRTCLAQNPALVHQAQKQGGFKPVHCVVRSHYRHHKGVELLALLKEYQADFNDRGSPYSRQNQPLSPLALVIAMFPLTKDLLLPCLREEYECDIEDNSVEAVLDMLTNYVIITREQMLDPKHWGDKGIMDTMIEIITFIRITRLQNSYHNNRNKKE